MVPYLCVRFHIFNTPILEEYVYHIKGGPHLLQSCLHVTQDGLPPTTKVIHLFKKSLIVTNAQGLHAFFMDIHHDTSLRLNLEDDSISLAFRARICYCLGKGVRLWLVANPFIYASHTLFSFQH